MTIMIIVNSIEAYIHCSCKYKIPMQIECKSPKVLSLEFLASLVSLELLCFRTRGLREKKCTSEATCPVQRKSSSQTSRLATQNPLCIKWSCAPRAMALVAHVLEC